MFFKPCSLPKFIFQMFPVKVTGDSFSRLSPTILPAIFSFSQAIVLVHLRKIGLVRTGPRRLDSLEEFVWNMLLPRQSQRCIYNTSIRTRHYATRTNRPQGKTFQIPQKPNVPKKSRVPLYVGGLVIYGASIYLGSSLYHIYNNSTETTSATQSPLDRVDSTTDSKPEVYDRIAQTYDSDIGLDEILMGLTWLRWWIVRSVRGDVLEVSSGTGRNMPYYRPGHIASLTFVDRSVEMQDIARTKWETIVRREPDWKEKQVKFIDVAVEGLSPNRQQFDTVVQSFGLCSVSDPVSYLSHLSQFCRHDGQIVLLEHGRSKYAWLNRILDNTVHKHAEKWGCFYNRDIAAVIEECKDVEVVSCQRWHFGTTYVYYLVPKQIK